MSGEWIKMRRELLTSPKVVRIMSACNADRFRTIGGLFAVWCLFDEHTEDGVLTGYSTEILDSMVGFPGLCQAMIEAGWLENLKENKGLRATNFGEHNGKTAKRRAQESVRKISARHADRNRTRSSSSSSSKDVPIDGLVDKKLEDVKPLEVDEQAWKDWIAVRKKKRAGLPTASVMKRMERESKEAGLTIGQAVAAAAEYEWAGFEAAWYRERVPQQVGRLPTAEERAKWRP
jgi:hypothetical protein